MLFAYTKALRSVRPAINLVISSDVESPNVYTLAASPYRAADVYLKINSGITVFSDNTANAALIIGAFKIGSRIFILNEGTIEAAAGAGGAGSIINYDNTFSGFCANRITTTSQPTVGAAAGDAIENTSGVDLIITNAGSFIYGGGGGGGGSGGSHEGKVGIYGCWQCGHGGGGGQGHNSAAGGTAGSQTGDAPNNGCNQGAAVNRQATGCVGTVGNAGGGTAGIAVATITNYSRSASQTEYTASAGASGAGGGYGNVGLAGNAGVATAPGSIATCFRTQNAGAAGGAAGKAIDLNGGTVTFISGGTSPNVEGAVS